MAMQPRALMTLGNKREAVCRLEAVLAAQPHVIPLRSTGIVFPSQHRPAEVTR
jgi:hypothetical protein